MTKSYSSESRSFSTVLSLLSWRIFGQPLFSLLPTPLFYCRVLLLRLYGATVASSVKIYPSVTIWLPRNLVICKGVGIGENVYLYNKSVITICSYSVISRETFICTASHDFHSPHFTLVSSPVKISSYCWICARASILPGVRVARGSVIALGCILTHSTKTWSVYAGNPGRLISNRSRLA